MIVVNWNGKRYLRDCLNSLLTQDYGSYDIWVVDNGSSDGSQDLVATEYPKVNLLLNTENRGFAAACNEVIGPSKSDAVALFNNDAIAHPSWLSELVKAMEADASIAVAGGPIFYRDHKDILWFSGGRVDGFTGVSWNIGQFSRKVIEDEIDTLSGCAMLIRASVVKKLGGLDEGYFLYTEDLDFCTRAKRKGYGLAFVPSAVTWHKVGGSGRLVPLRTYYLKLRSDIRFALKNLAWWSVPVAPLVQAFALTSMDSFTQSEGPRVMYVGFKALAWNMSHLQETFKQRSGQSGSAMGPKHRFRELAQTACLRLLRRKRFGPYGLEAEPEERLELQGLERTLGY